MMSSTVTRRPTLEQTISSSEILQSLDEAVIRDLAGHCERLDVPRGATLMRQGEAGDCLYFVVRGRLRFFVDSENHPEPIVGEVGAGETVGEMALVTGEPRSATVCALRDSQLLRIKQDKFDQLIQDHPKMVLQLMRMIIRRQQRLRSSRLPATPSTILILPVPGTPLEEFSQKLAEQLRRLGPTECVTARRADEVLGKGSAESPQEGESHARLVGWLSGLEVAHRFLLLLGEPTASNWNRHCVRQADLVLLLARSSDPVQPCAAEACLENLDPRTAPTLDLVLLREAGETLPTGTAGWLEPRQVSRHCHLRINTPRDFARLSRTITDRAVGVVLGGGGARGFAHIGAVRALQESDLPIDIIGGCSMGAIVSAMFAHGWDWERVLETNRQIWLRSGSLFDFTFPLVSFIAGKKGERLVQRLFDGTQIEDLWTSYFCVSADMANAVLATHTRGTLWKALVASAALPGIVPPRVFGGNLHCDGGILDNVPVASMRALTHGPILAVDVGAPERLKVKPDLEACPPGSVLLLQRLNPWRESLKVPNILSIMVNSAFLPSTQRTEEVKRVADYYVRPKIDHYALFAFDKLDELAECGYESMCEQLDKWRAVIERRLPEVVPGER